MCNNYELCSLKFIKLTNLIFSNIHSNLKGYVCLQAAIHYVLVLTLIVPVPLSPLMYTLNVASMGVNLLTMD